MQSAFEAFNYLAGLSKMPLNVGSQARPTCNPLLKLSTIWLEMGKLPKIDVPPTKFCTFNFPKCPLILDLRHCQFMSLGRLNDHFWSEKLSFQGCTFHVDTPSAKLRRCDVALRLHFIPLGSAACTEAAYCPPGSAACTEAPGRQHAQRQRMVAKGNFRLRAPKKPQELPETKKIL